MATTNETSGYAVLKTVFLTGETSYNVNAICKSGSQTDSFIKSVTKRISIDIRDGKKLNRIQQFFNDNQVERCEVIQVVESLESAKRLVNLQMEIDELCIRTNRFNV